MYAIIINAIAVVLGSAIGALFKRGISEKYINVLNTAMGLCALALGMNVAIDSMQKTHYPALFIFCLSIGGLVGTVCKMDQRMEKATRRISTTNLAEGITTGILLCCVGTLAMMGPVMSALYGDNTYLMTAATLNLVTMVVVASSYGFGVAITSVAVLVWMSAIYGIALVSRSFISEELISEVSLVGGILIAASGLGVLHIKDCKTINLLPALIVPMLFFAARALLAMWGLSFEAFPGHKHLPFCWDTNILHLTLIRYNKLIISAFNSVRCFKAILHKTYTPRLTSYTSEKGDTGAKEGEFDTGEYATMRPCNFATQQRVLTA